MAAEHRETIAAIATPPGRGGVGIIRISGPLVRTVIDGLIAHPLLPREARYTSFRETNGDILDQGLALFFMGPSSYTGEDCLELQAHGNPLLLDRLLARLTELGCRLARPGEFTERAFLNGKLDLAQAEAVADLIEAGTETALRAAQGSLCGDFSRRIKALVDDCIRLRCQTEAAIDFIDEDIDPLSLRGVAEGLVSLEAALQEILAISRQGALLREGMTLILLGRPNAGKSSLLNVLSGEDRAIVTEIPGTTRDLVRVRLDLGGVPVELIDTAGLRDDPADAIEAEGIRRTQMALQSAEAALVVSDDSEPESASALLTSLPGSLPRLWIRNKIDLSGNPPGFEETPYGPSIRVSLKTLEGLSTLEKALGRLTGSSPQAEPPFLARRRHIDALERAHQALKEALTCGEIGNTELVAEQLRRVQASLGEITGTFSSDDLLGEIFSSFCIGK